MKSGLILATLAQLAIAQPHRAHHHQHKRDAVDTVVQVDIVTAQAAVVFVNAEGVPISTSFPAGAAATPVTQPTSPVVVQALTPSPTETPSAYIAPTQSIPLPSDAPSNTGGSGTLNIGLGGSGYGLSYSPYNDDSSCKTQDQVNSDFEMISGYSFIRLYGVDCNQVTTVGNAAKAKGMNLMAGVYDINAVSSELNTMIQAVNGDFSYIPYITIGNEVVNSGIASVSEVTAAIQQARSILGSTNFKGQIATVDTGSVMMNSANSGLCEASDFAGANIHAFFDSTAVAADAGQTVMNQVKQIEANCPGKQVIVCESGYPYQGQTNGLAVPSVANQIAAIASLKSTFNNNLVLFSAFDDMWKQNSAGTFDAEQYWGLLSHSTSL